MRRILLPGALLFLMACAKKAGEAGAADHADKDAAAVTADVADVTAQSFTETVDALGVVVPRMGHVVSLAAPAPTRVARVFVTVGAHVSKDDPLVEFEQASFDAASKGADAVLASAQKAADRAQRLADAGVLPRKDAETAASDLAQAQLAAVNAKRARELSTLRAPIGGVVTKMSAVMGASVDPNQALVEVADPDALDAMLSFSLGDAARVRVGETATLFAGAEAAGTPAAHGRVADVAAAVDTSSRAVSVRVEINAGTPILRIGATVFGRIAVSEHAKAIVVPMESLVPTGEGFKVFVVDSEGVAHSREVKLGGRNDHGAWVTEGLKPGERIVTHGAYGVDDSAKVITKGGSKEP